MISRSAFDARLFEFKTQAEAHNRELLKFLASSPYGEPLLNRELARQGISRAAFDRSRTINVEVVTVEEAA